MFWSLNVDFGDVLICAKIAENFNLASFSTFFYWRMSTDFVDNIS